MGHRRDRLDKRLAKAASTRQVNSVKKESERDRRETDMIDILKKGKLPYTPGVMSWLSERLDKKASKIEQADIDSLVG